MSSGGIKGGGGGGGGGGGMGAFSPSLVPPPRQKKKWSNQPFSANFDFCPLRNALCPLDAHKKKKKILVLPLNPPGGGGTLIFGRTGMCRSNGSLFNKKSLNMGPAFYQKILKHGSTFLTEPKLSGFRMAKIAKFLKNGPIFQEKSLKMGTLFCQNHP